MKSNYKVGFYVILMIGSAIFIDFFSNKIMNQMITNMSQNKDFLNEMFEFTAILSQYKSLLTYPVFVFIGVLLLIEFNRNFGVGINLLGFIVSLGICLMNIAFYIHSVMNMKSNNINVQVLINNYMFINLIVLIVLSSFLLFYSVVFLFRLIKNYKIKEEDDYFEMTKKNYLFIFSSLSFLFLGIFIFFYSQNIYEGFDYIIKETTNGFKNTLDGNKNIVLDLILNNLKINNISSFSALKLIKDIHKIFNCVGVILLAFSTYFMLKNFQKDKEIV